MQVILKSTLILAALVGAVAAQAADSATQDKAAKPKRNTSACVFFRSVYDWRALDDNHLVLWSPSSKKEAYLVQLAMPLFSLRFAHTLAFVDGNNDGRLCDFGRDAIADTDRSMPQQSTIISLTRLDAEATAKLEEKYKIKLVPEPRKKKIPKEPVGESAK